MQLLVRLRLLTCGNDDQSGRHRPEDRKHQPRRHEFRRETGRHRLAGHDARDEDRGNDDEPAEQAQPAQPFGPGDLPGPLLLGDHGFLFPPPDPSPKDSGPCTKRTFHGRFVHLVHNLEGIWPKVPCQVGTTSMARSRS